MQALHLVHAHRTYTLYAGVRGGAWLPRAHDTNSTATVRDTTTGCYWLLVQASLTHRPIATSPARVHFLLFQFSSCWPVCSCVTFLFFFLSLFLHTKSHGVGLRLRPTHPVQVGTHTVSSLTHLLDCCNLGIVVTAKCSSPRVWLLREQS